MDVERAIDRERFRITRDSLVLERVVESAVKHDSLVRVVESAVKRNRPARAASAERYIFSVVDDVFDEATLAGLREQYGAAERLVERYGARTLADGSYVFRNGRYDVALGRPRDEISQFVLTNMDQAGVNARFRGGVRALIVPRASDEQPWHADLRTEARLPRYVTLLVALEDMPADGDGLTEFRVPSIPEDGILSVLADGTAFDPDDESLPIVKPTLRANQGVLFDGRIVHRGGRSTRRRPPVVYSVYTEPALEENI